MDGAKAIGTAFTDKPVTAWGGLALLRVDEPNRQEYRGSTFRVVMLVLNFLFFGFFFCVFTLSQFFGLKF